MKRNQTKKKCNKPRKTQKNKRCKGGDNVDAYYYMVSESETRPNYPVVRVIHMPGNGVSGSFQFEEYLSNIAYEIEDQLAAIALNKNGIRTPKQIRIKKHVIRKPPYIPPMM